MNYTEATAAVAAGKKAWRAASGAGNFITKSASGATVDQSGRPYTASAADSAATDWSTGDSH